MLTTVAAGRVFDYSYCIGMYGMSGQGFWAPQDFVLGEGNLIYVISRGVEEIGQRVTRVTRDHEFLGQFGAAGRGDGQFVWPRSIDLDSAGNVFASDDFLHRISVFDKEGAFLSSWGTAGSGEGELNGPSGIAFDADDNLFVVDSANNRIQKFTNDGEFLAAFGSTGYGEGQFQRPTGVAVDPEGFIYVADWGNERVQVLSADGSFQLILRGEATISKWASEYLASNPEEKAERDISNLIPELPAHLNTPYHISSQTEPYFWGPVSVSLDREGRLYVTETNRHRFQVYQKR